MQTPAGYAINADGQFVPAGSWLPIIFTASFPYRLVHTVIAAYLTTALAVGGAGAWPFAARPDKSRRAQDVFNGDVDGGHRHPNSNSGGGTRMG
jgi:cytochrome bd-type quinol oxidase subunit 1